MGLAGSLEHKKALAGLRYLKPIGPKCDKQTANADSRSFFQVSLSWHERTVPAWRESSLARCAIASGPIGKRATKSQKFDRNLAQIDRAGAL